MCSDSLQSLDLFWHQFWRLAGVQCGHAGFIVPPLLFQLFAEKVSWKENNPSRGLWLVLTILMWSNQFKLWLLNLTALSLFLPAELEDQRLHRFSFFFFNFSNSIFKTQEGSMWRCHGFYLYAFFFLNVFFIQGWLEKASEVEWLLFVDKGAKREEDQGPPGWLSTDFFYFS